MADVTIKLAYIKERDGLVFLVDKEGKELPNVCLVPRRSIEWMSQSPSTAQQQIDRWAAEVDVSAAVIEPEMFAVFDDEGLPVHITIDRQMALDHIKNALQLVCDCGDEESAKAIAKYRVRPVIVGSALEGK